MTVIYSLKAIQSNIDRIEEIFNYFHFGQVENRTSDFYIGWLEEIKLCCSKILRDNQAYYWGGDPSTHEDPSIFMRYPTDDEFVFTAKEVFELSKRLKQSFESTFSYNGEVKRPWEDNETYLKYSSKLDAALTEFFEELAEKNDFFWKIRGEYQFVESARPINAKAPEKEITHSQELSFQPIHLSKTCRKNLIPSIFYQLLSERLIDTSKENLKDLLLAILRDSDGTRLSESYMDDLLNSSKEDKRSKNASKYLP